jgi:Zn-dependent protease
MELFRVRGIPVRIDVGWLLIFGLIAWSLAAGYFPHVLPSQSPAAYWAQGAAAALLLFVSVLLHELAHALVALRHGVPVGGITLHLFGGVSQLEREPETPRAELLIAVVGPLTSFAVAGATAGLGRLLTTPAWVVALTGYLAAVNLVVGVFNLVPAFPLDGGRILRAALWAWSGSADRATRVASRVGSMAALLMLVVGVVRAFAGDVLGGLWLALIGLFLYRAARASQELLHVRACLEALRVGQVMRTGPAAVEEARRELAPGSPAPVVAPLDSAWHAFLTMARAGQPRVPVVEGGALIGVVTQRDLHDLVAGEEASGGAARRAA